MTHMNTLREMSTWNVLISQHVRNKLQKINEAPVIDYHNLQWLCNITSREKRDCLLPEKEKHEIFMQNYRKMFASQKACPLNAEKIDLYTSSHLHNHVRETRPDFCFLFHMCHRGRYIRHQLEHLRVIIPGKGKAHHKPARSELQINENTYNIKDYLRLLHKERKSEDSESVKTENLQTLRRILKKLPFERTPGDNDKIFSILQTLDFFRKKVDLTILKHLCTVAYMETFKEENFAVYGKTGIHLILSGSVVPFCEPYIMADKEDDYPQTFVTLDESGSTDLSRHILLPGNCFGTWLLHGQPYTNDFCVQTKEPNCEFMKISVSDYKLIIAKIKHREHAEKLNLLVSCDQYRMWPRQPLIAVADCVDWISYPLNTVLAKEGSLSPFIGFIRSGECHVLRQVHVLPIHKNGKHRSKQIVVGRLGPFDSFAEMSVLLDEPITCSIVTATIVDLGIIRPEKIQSLDEVTRQLIIQSSTRIFGYLTKEDIQNEYLQQELARKWNQFKHAQVIEVISAKSGGGK